MSRNVEMGEAKEAIHGAVVFDLQGTLTTPGFILPDRSILTQAEALRTGRIDEVYAEEYESTPVVNGEYAHVTIEQMRRLRAVGMLLYIATGDGGGEYEPGSMTPERLITEFGVPIPEEHVVNWARLESEGFGRHYAAPAEGSDKSDKKNDLLDFICQHSGLQPKDICFFDDGPGNVNGAKRFGVKRATQVDVPANLTDGLNEILVELGLDPVPVEPPAHDAVAAVEAGAVVAGVASIDSDVLSRGQLLASLLSAGRETKVDPKIAGLLQGALLAGEGDSAVQLAKMCEVYVGLHDLGVKYGQPTAQSAQSVLVRFNKAGVCQSLLKTLRLVIGCFDQGGQRLADIRGLLLLKLKAISDNPDQQKILFAGRDSEFKKLYNDLRSALHVEVSAGADSAVPPPGSGK